MSATAGSDVVAVDESLPRKTGLAVVGIAMRPQAERLLRYAAANLRVDATDLCTVRA
jgi:RNase P/RNase MRP subunit p30